MNGKPLTKSQLSDSLAEKAGITKATAKTVIDAVASIACEEVREKGEFTIPGIGKLVISDRSARMGRNPATGRNDKHTREKGPEVPRGESLQGRCAGLKPSPRPA